MRRHWSTGITQLLLGMGLLVLFGAAFDAAGLLLTLGLLAYTGWTSWQLVRLHRWLDGRGGSEPPESHGLWGDIFDGIYELQKKQKKSRRRLRKIISRVQSSLSALRDGVVMIDSNRSLEWWNEAAEDMFGFRDPADRGQHISNLVRTPAFIQYFEKKDFSEPLEMRAPLHPRRILQVLITEFGKQDHLLIARDVSQLHQLEQMRRDFVANLSHELKTPLTVLRGYLETLLDTGTADPAMQEVLEEMRQQGERMDNLIRDLLYLSRLENEVTPHHADTVDLPTLLGRVIKDAQLLSSEKSQQVEISFDPGVHLLGSENELYSAFSNLLLNAVKYTQDGGTIQVTCTRTAEGAEVHFTDNGPGIDYQHLNRLTERFYRVDKSRSIETGGTGLGLAIVKHVLLRHDAQLDIRSEPGQGSTFICRFGKKRLLQAAA